MQYEVPYIQPLHQYTRTLQQSNNNASLLAGKPAHCWKAIRLHCSAFSHCSSASTLQHITAQLRHFHTAYTLHLSKKKHLRLQNSKEDTPRFKVSMAHCTYTYMTDTPKNSMYTSKSQTTAVQFAYYSTVQ
jgi:hypothetical protein